MSYSPALKTFEAAWRHLAPDALLLAGLRRRDLPVRGDAPDPAPFRHDRPGNSLFLPPEYRSVNCHVCSGSVQGVTIVVRGAVQGRSATVQILINGACWYDYGAGGPFRLGASWGHSLSYATARPRRSHVFRAQGTYEVKDRVECQGCASPAAMGGGTATVTVEAPCNPGQPPSYAAATPAVQQQAAEITGGAWGAYSVIATGRHLECTEICPETYRIQGNAVTGAWATATTRIAALGSCTAAARATDDISRTVAHERHHVTTLVNLANSLQTRRDYSTMAACRRRLTTIRALFMRTYSREERNQLCHDDPYFANEYIYARYCPPPRNTANPETRPTQEVVTTSRIYGQCSGL